MDSSSELEPQQTREIVDESRLAWLALALTPGIGTRRIHQAVERIGSAIQVVNLPLTQLESLHFPAQSVQFISEGLAMSAARQQWEQLHNAGATFLAYSDEDYPERLREIFDPAVVLWVRGNAKLFSLPSIAVVGTRHPTPYGAGMAEMLSRDLATRDLSFSVAWPAVLIPTRIAEPSTFSAPPSLYGEPASMSSIRRRTSHWPKRFFLEEGPSFPNIHSALFRRRKIFLAAIACSAA